MARNPAIRTTETVDTPPKIPGGFSQTIVETEEAIQLAEADRQKLLETMPKPKRYRVINGGRVNFGGYVHAVRAGKIVDDASDDIRALMDQGIVLDEIV